MLRELLVMRILLRDWGKGERVEESLYVFVVLVAKRGNAGQPILHGILLLGRAKD